jgi:hypothetical protein
LASADRLTSHASQIDDEEIFDQGFSLTGWVRDEYQELVGKVGSQETRGKDSRLSDAHPRHPLLPRHFSLH